MSCFHTNLMTFLTPYLSCAGHVEELPHAAALIRILVNWMHGNSHSLACQLANIGRYASDAAHRDGENVERLWGLTKVTNRVW